MAGRHSRIFRRAVRGQQRVRQEVVVRNDSFRRRHLLIVMPHPALVQINPEYQMPGLDLIALA